MINTKEKTKLIYRSVINCMAGNERKVKQLCNKINYNNWIDCYYWDSKGTKYKAKLNTNKEQIIINNNMYNIRNIA